MAKVHASAHIRDDNLRQSGEGRVAFLTIDRARFLSKMTPPFLTKNRCQKRPKGPIRFDNAVFGMSYRVNCQKQPLVPRNHDLTFDI